MLFITSVPHLISFHLYYFSLILHSFSLLSVSSSFLHLVIFCPLLSLQSSSITDHAGMCVCVCLVFWLLVGFWCARCRLIGEGQINVAVLCGECLMGRLWIFDEKERMRELYMATESWRYEDRVRVALSKAGIVDGYSLTTACKLLFCIRALIQTVSSIFLLPTLLGSSLISL